MFMATLTILISVGGFMFVRFMNENSGWDNKMVIEYRSLKEFDRGIFKDMVEKSEIMTNFVNCEITMDKHFIRYVLTNPETQK